MSPSHLGNPVETEKRCVSHFPSQPYVVGNPRYMYERLPTSNNLAFPFSSASLSFSRRYSCALSFSKVFILRACCVLFFRRASTSEVTRLSRSCSSERDRWASDKSARVILRRSVGVGPNSPDRCFLDGVTKGDGIER